MFLTFVITTIKNLPGTATGSRKTGDIWSRSRLNLHFGARPREAKSIVPELTHRYKSKERLLPAAEVMWLLCGKSRFSFYENCIPGF